MNEPSSGPRVSGTWSWSLALRRRMPINWCPWRPISRGTSQAASGPRKRLQGGDVPANVRHIRLSSLTHWACQKLKNGPGRCW
jgi:hypothetical protein